eukprot:scaffold15288_cov91-Skeletonema_dohrnii-CCMP3373.AAC.1
MASIQFIRPRTAVKLAIAAFIAFFLVTNMIDEREAEDGSALHLLRNEQKDDDQHNHVNVTASIISNVSFSDNEQKLPDDNKSDNHGDHHNNYSLAQNAVNSTATKPIISNTSFGAEGNNYGDHNDDVNIPATMGYYNLSCPFEMYKYSCAAMQDNESDEQVTAASMQYYQQHLAEIWRAFDSVFNDQINPQQKPKRIFMQEILSSDRTIGCPMEKEVALSGGSNKVYNHRRGFRVAGEGDVLQRMKRQVDDSGEIDFGTKTAFPPSGPMDVLVYELGAHRKPRKSREMLNRFASDIAMPLMRSKSEQRPKIVFVTTPTSHFNTTDGQYLLNGMNDEQKQCVDRVTRNPRAELEKQIIKSGVNVDVLLDYDDLELGALHVHKGDCLHYCMPGAVDLVGARLLDSF